MKDLIFKIDELSRKKVLSPCKYEFLLQPNEVSKDTKIYTLYTSWTRKVLLKKERQALSEIFFLGWLLKVKKTHADTVGRTSCVTVRHFVR